MTCHHDLVAMAIVAMTTPCVCRPLGHKVQEEELSSVTHPAADIHCNFSWFYFFAIIGSMQGLKETPVQSSRTIMFSVWPSNFSYLLA